MGTVLRYFAYIGAAALVALSTAHAQVGSNAYGGACFGAYCDPQPPVMGGGTNAYGGDCLGAYCEQSGEREPSPYQPYPTAQPLMPENPPDAAPAHDPFSNNFDTDSGR
jgi:hypothetical protein